MSSAMRGDAEADIVEATNKARREDEINGAIALDGDSEDEFNEGCQIQTYSSSNALAASVGWEWKDDEGPSAATLAHL
jgi:hypothetical protein